MRAALLAGLAAAALAFGILALAAGIGGGRSEGRSAAPLAPAQAGVPVGREAGHAVFVRMGCGSCHTLAAAGSKGTFGPNLDERLPAHTRDSLIARIMAPPSIDDYSGMPTNFATRMNARELDALVSFLLAAR